MGTDITVDGLINIANKLSCYFYDIAITGLVIFTIVAGIRFMMAGGNPEKVGQAKKNFRTVLIGALVIFGVFVIINTISASVGSSYRIQLICS